MLRAPRGPAGAMDRGRGKRSRGARTCCRAGRGRENRDREAGEGEERESGAVVGRGGDWKTRCCVCRCLLLPGQPGLVPHVRELGCLLCVKPGFSYTQSLNFIKEFPTGFLRTASSSHPVSLRKDT